MNRFFRTTSTADGLFNELNDLADPTQFLQYVFNCNAASLTTTRYSTFNPVSGGVTLGSSAPTAFTAKGWREGPYTGFLAASQWGIIEFSTYIANTGVTGTVYARVWKSADANGSGATQIGTTMSQAVTRGDGTYQQYQMSMDVGNISLDNEYLFIEMWWKTTTAVAGQTASVMLIDSYGEEHWAYFQRTNLAYLYAHTPIGGYLIGHAATYQCAVMQPSSVAAVLGGEAAISVGVAPPPIGGFVMSDSRHYTVAQSSTGGAVVSGLAAVVGQYTYTVADVAGGGVLGGVAQIDAFNVQIVTQTPTGGAVAGNTATALGINVQVGTHYITGGAVAGGTPVYRCTTSRLAAGGTVAGGTAIYVRRASQIPSGGVIAGGAGLFPPPQVSIISFAKQPAAVSSIARIED